LIAFAGAPQQKPAEETHGVDGNYLITQHTAERRLSI
jgi:hypothetical protein